MNRTTLIIVIAGFGFALLAALVAQMVGGKGKSTSAETSQTVAVLVASRDIKIGEELGKGSMEWANWPLSAKFPGAIAREGVQKPEEALKGRVRRAISKGEPMAQNMVVAETKTNFVAASLAKGKRAVTVSVNAQSSVGGFVNPGDFVDVILTYDVKLPSDDKIRKTAETVVTKLAAETVVENLRVLAVDTDTKKSEPKVGKTVTLEADPKQAESLALAAKMGTISLALRSLGDETPAHAADAKNFQTTTDLRLSGVMREITKGENKSGSITQVVRVYSGSRVDNIEVRPYSTQ
ncbi:MAG: Flp pilus assembly protein CpaB [Alphaproteobacteria bacterium]|nr:Flp pilus assembly protein CpaB [Alphaproteobacteria bacterium]